MNDILMQVRDLSYRYEDQTLALDKVLPYTPYRFGL